MILKTNATARATKSTMHACMARAIHGTVGRQEGNGSAKITPKSLGCIPFSFILTQIQLNHHLTAGKASHAVCCWV